MGRPPSRLGVSWQPHESAAEGLPLARVVAGSAADRAGLKVGDRILEFADRPIRSGKDLQAAVLHADKQTTARVSQAEQEEPSELEIQLDGTPMRL